MDNETPLGPTYRMFQEVMAKLVFSTDQETYLQNKLDLEEVIEDIGLFLEGEEIFANLRSP
jgi:hypothetical protein